MPDYLVFSGCLRSELPMPELAPAHGLAPSWALRFGTLSDTPLDEVLGDVSLTPSCRMRITRHGQARRYAHSCTGVFEVAPDGRTIVFAPSANPSFDLARTDIVARVLLLCAQPHGVTWLHGSAVQLGASAAGFIGPSGAGKSTLALALTIGGGRHVCDDTLPVKMGDPPHVWASDQTLRVNDDSRLRLARGVDAVRRESDGKLVLTHDSLTRSHDSAFVTHAHVPLSVIYYLCTNAPEATVLPGAKAAVRRRLSDREAIVALMAQLKLGPVYPPDAPVRALHAVTALLGHIPVYELRITRDWAVIDEVVDTLMEWHRSAGDATRSRAKAST